MQALRKTPSSLPKCYDWRYWKQRRAEMASEEFGRQVDRVAELLAQRAKRKLGMPRDLRLVGEESEPQVKPVGAAEPTALPDWTTFAPIDVSPKARKMHEIMVIANSYNWQIPITHFLLTKGVPYLTDLTDPQLDDLLDRMHGYVDAAEIGASLENCLPAN